MVKMLQMEVQMFGMNHLKLLSDINLGNLSGLLCSSSFIVGLLLNCQEVGLAFFLVYAVNICFYVFFFVDLGNPLYNRKIASMWSAKNMVSSYGDKTPIGK